jgi:hypothetical protein
MNRDGRLKNDVRDMDTWDMGYYLLVLKKRKRKKNTL